MNHSIPNNHSNIISHNQDQRHNMNNQQRHNINHHSNNAPQQHHPQPLNPYQVQQRKEAEQRRRLQQIVDQARNKLQMIESRHISFEYEVGRGKFGKVFRALWTDSHSASKQQKTVAVKWFKQDEVDQEVFEDFLKEICMFT